MISLCEYLRDKDVYEFVESALVARYDKYGIPSKVPKDIINILGTNQDISVALQKLNQLIDIKDKSSLFWQGRKKYDSKKLRYHEVISYIDQWITGNTALEVGCGNGKLGSILIKSHKLEKYIGTDVYLTNVLGTNQQIKFIKQTVTTSIPVENNIADTILIIDMLHHVEKNDQEKLLNNI